MRKTTDIIYGGVGQTVEYRVPQGRPTSATFKVFLDDVGDDGTPLFSGTASVENVTQNLTSSSGPSQSDPTRVNVVSTNISTDRKYLLSEGSKKEWISPVEVGSGFIRSRFELKNDYTTAATLVGTTITAAIDDTFAASLQYVSNQEDPHPSYRVRWSIVVGGVTVPAYSFFNLVRAQVLHDIDINDLNDRAPGLARTLPTEYRAEQGRPLIEAAWRSVRADLAACKLSVDAIRDDESLDELVILKGLVIVAEGGWKPASWDQGGIPYVTDRRDRYDRFLEQHVKVTLAIPVAVGPDSGVSTPCPPKYFSK